MEAETNGAHSTQDRLLYALVLDMKAMRADAAAYRANTASVKVNSELAVGKVDECLQALMDMHRVHASVVLRLSAPEEAMAVVVSNSASGSSMTAPAISAASPQVLRPLWALRKQVCFSLSYFLSSNIVLERRGSCRRWEPAWRLTTARVHVVVPGALVCNVRLHLPRLCLPPSQKEVRRRYSGTVICATTPKDGNPDANDLYWMSVLVIHEHPVITTMEQAVEFGNTPIWLKGRLCASNPAKADLRVVLFEYLRRPVAAWHFQSQAIISKIFINRICVLLNCGDQVREGCNQGQWVMESIDAQGLLYNDKLFKNAKCKDACLIALHGWLEWGLYLDKFYTFPTEVNGEGTYKVYMHIYAFFTAKVRFICVL